MLRLLREILRRRAALGVACVAAALLLGACDDSSSPGPPLGPPGTTLVYRLELPGGAAPSAAQLDEAARVASKRFASDGDLRVSIVPARTAGCLDVALWSQAPEDVARARALLERAGSLAFRVRAETAVEQEAREARNAGGAATAPPAGFAWIPYREPESPVPDLLVHVPEAPLAAELETLARSGAPDAAAVGALRERLAETLRTDLFTDADLASASVVTQGPSVCVAFEIAEERKAAFAKFTRRHIGRQLAILLDGVVEVVPVIRSELPGHGIIEGGGAGFTETEARDLSAVLTAGRLPGRLVPVSPSAPGASGK